MQNAGVWDEGVVLLVAEEAVADHARVSRDRYRQPLMTLPDVPDVEAVDDLRSAIWWSDSRDGLDAPRFERVCVVAFPSAPVRTWACAFFAAEMPWLVDSGGLGWCLPPFDPRHVTPVGKRDRRRLADEWDQLRPAPAPSASGARLQPGSGRPGTGGYWGGPEVAVSRTDPALCHLQVRPGRRSFCGLRAKDLDPPDPYFRYEDVPPGRHCPECARRWWDELRPERERERRGIVRRLEAVAGMVRAMDDFEAIDQAIGRAANRPTAHAALTAAPFGYTDLQAFHILNLPVASRTAEGQADLHAEQASLESQLADLEGALAGPPGTGT